MKADEVGSENPASLLAYGVILPAQYYAGHAARDPRIVPFKHLLLAVLEDAVRCFQSHIDATSPKRRRLWLEAWQWITSDRADGPLSYVTVCEALGIEPGYLRRGLENWKAQRLGNHPFRRLVRRSPVRGISKVVSLPSRGKKGRAAREGSREP